MEPELEQAKEVELELDLVKEVQLELDLKTKPVTLEVKRTINCCDTLVFVQSYKI